MSDPVQPTAPRRRKVTEAIAPATSPSSSSSSTPAAEVLAGLHVGGVAAATGIPGSGKTTTVLEALERTPWGKRAVVFDPYAARDRANWNAGHRDRKPFWPSSPLATLDTLLRKPAILDAPQRRLVVCGTRGTLDHAALGRDFATLVELVWLTGGYALVAEECGVYGRMAAEAINRVATGGAHAGMRLVLLCQRLGRIQKDAREGIGLLVCGAQGAPEDFDDLAKRCGRAFADRVRQLRPPNNGRPQDPPIAWRLGEGLTPEKDSST